MAKDEHTSLVLFQSFLAVELFEVACVHDSHCQRLSLSFGPRWRLSHCLSTRGLKRRNQMIVCRLLYRLCWHQYRAEASHVGSVVARLHMRLLDMTLQMAERKPRLHESRLSQTYTSS